MAEITSPLVDPDKILKEVHNVKGIEAKTELSFSQIEVVNKSQTLGLVFGNPLMIAHLNTFMILQKSKDRKSMAEFVESLRSKKEEIISKSKSFHLLG